MRADEVENALAMGASSFVVSHRAIPGPHLKHGRGLRPLSSAVQQQRAKKRKKIMHCTKCGKEMNEGQQFCTSCGTPATGSAATSQGGVTTCATSLFERAKKLIYIRKWNIVGILVAVVVIGFLLGGGSIEEQSEKLFKEIIQEKFLAENKIDKYIALDKVENFEIKKDSASGEKNKWIGTADVTFKAKRGRGSITTIYKVYVDDRGKELYVSCEPKNKTRFGEKLSELLESAGYEED